MNDIHYQLKSMIEANRTMIHGATRTEYLSSQFDKIEVRRDYDIITARRREMSTHAWETTAAVSASVASGYPSNYMVEV